MGTIRPFIASDIPQVAELHRTVFRTAAPGDAVRAAYHSYLTRVFLENPTADPRLPSLVHEERGGSITGFLGVVPRRMTMNGRRVTAAVSSQFIVTPSRTAGVIALRLAGVFFNGPQDLSISDEATDTSRKIWEGLGGITAPWHSLYWTRPLRPVQFAASVLGGPSGFGSFVRMAAPVVEAVAARTPLGRFGRVTGTSVPEALTERTVLEWLPRWAGEHSLRIDYDEPTLAWLFARAQHKAPGGAFRATAVGHGGRVVGWHLYHLDTDRAATVLQIGADPGRIREVVDHLFAHASSDGAIAVSGRVHSRDVHVLTERYCLLHRRGPWVLVKTRHEDLLRPFETGEACFSRFDGEWCLGF